MGFVRLSCFGRRVPPATVLFRQLEGRTPSAKRRQVPGLLQGNSNLFRTSTVSSHLSGGRNCSSPVWGPTCLRSRWFSVGGRVVNPFSALEIPKNATANEVKAAYRRLALQWHPDRNPNNLEAEERFKEISQAYEILRNPEQRKMYAAGMHTAQGGFSPQSQGMPTMTEEQVIALFTEIFGDKTLTEIIEEMEGAMQEQQRQAEAESGRLQQQSFELRARAHLLKRQAALATTDRERARLNSASEEQEHQALRVDTTRSITAWGHLMQKHQHRRTLANLRRLDPVHQSEERKRRLLMCGSLFSFYVLAGLNFIPSLFLTLSVGIVARYLLPQMRRLRAHMKKKIK